MRRLKLVSEAREVVRPVSVCMIAIAVVACAMAGSGWHAGSLAMAGVLVVIAAILIFQVHRAVRYLRQQSRQVRRSAAEAERHYVKVLWRINHFVEGRDRFSAGHSQNVGRLAGLIARQLGLPEEQCRLLVLGGRLHDIGLLAVPEAVIQSRAEFGTEELRSVQKHSEVSYDVLKPLEMLGEVLPGIRYHHERLNGTGYPAGLRGEQIPLAARILAVADSYDAMTHDRAHRPAMSPLAAMRELRRCCPAGYDPQCVEALAEVVNLRALEEAAAAREPACCA